MASTIVESSIARCQSSLPSAASRACSRPTSCGQTPPVATHQTVANTSSPTGGRPPGAAPSKGSPNATPSGSPPNKPAPNNASAPDSETAAPAPATTARPHAKASQGPAPASRPSRTSRSNDTDRVRDPTTGPFITRPFKERTRFRGSSEIRGPARAALSGGRVSRRRARVPWRRRHRPEARAPASSAVNANRRPPRAPRSSRPRSTGRSSRRSRR